MLKKITALAVGLGALTFAQSASAQSGSIAEIAIAHVDDTTGVELALGYSFRANGFRLTPIIGGFAYQGDEDPRYGNETFGNGQTVCRDYSNGQFAKKEKCETGFAASAYAKLEAAYRYKSIEIGAGVRASDETTGYVTVAAFLGSGGSIKLSAGQDYYSAGLSVGF